MSKRFDWQLIFGFAIVLALLLAMVACIFALFHLLGNGSGKDACQDALTAADARYQLSESTTALVYDQWRADNAGDAHGVEYAAAGIQANADEIDALTTDYENYKKECND